MVSSKRHVFTVLAVAIAGSLLYFYADPSYSIYFPKCIFYSLTSLYCPGCGSQRAIHALLHGDIAAAADYNLLLVLALPLIAFSAIVITNNIFRQKKIQQQLFYSNTFTWTLFVVVILFFALRNIPATPFRFLAP